MHESMSKQMVDIALTKEQEVGFKPDGTGFLTATALWDSSVHDSTFLNRVTASSHRILLQLSWFIVVDVCSEPVQFNMDVVVTMHTRDASPPSRF